MRVGVDTGGTFTDVVDERGAILKLLSTPADPSAAVRASLAEVGGGAGSGITVLAHGTTVATNTLLERRGAHVGLLTNAGFEDLIEIARQDRPSLYDQWADRPVPLVARPLRVGVGCRVAADGAELAPIDPATIAAFPADVDTVAVCFLHADRFPAHEVAAVAELHRRGVDAIASHDVSPEHREYERMVTTVVNAYVQPSCAAYLARLAGAAPMVLVMTSAGGLVPLDRAVERPATLLLSGPAAGVQAAASVAAANGFPNAVSFDMGGTSTDVCLIWGGVPAPSPSLEIGGFPVRLPALDIHTIGAGGGSIASLDAGGALRVGPESAGSEPGPACYGLGGTQPTVTDANLLLGRLPPGSALPGLGLLDFEAAQVALAQAGVTADGVVAVVDAAMAQAVRRVTVERGVDPRDLALVAFGGAGPMHACGLAELVGISTVIIPARAGVLCAVGLLAAPEQHDVVRSLPRGADVEAALAAVERAARALLGDDAGVEVSTSLDCRYPGQSHELTVATVDAFHDEHERRNGYADRTAAVEVVAVRASARAASSIAVDVLPPIERHAVVGPAIVSEPDCTIWVPEGWRGEPGAGGALVLSRARANDGAAGDGGDAAALAVLIGRLEGVADEMGAVLRRAAFSPNIKERADCSAALFNAAGEQLVQAEHIPVHLGAMPASVRAVLDAFPSAAGLEPGDQVVVNDPFAGGTHLNDVTFVAPAFVDGELVGWAANRAHHADLGGGAPGSMPAHATEIFHEGLRIPPVRWSPAVRAMIMANSRTPDERGGDLDAQVGANALGVARLTELVARGEPVDDVLGYGERRMRAALAAVDDGSWRFEDVLDSTGEAASQQRPARVVVAVTVAGDEIAFDFTGTDPQRAGNVNAVEAVTVSSVAYALRVATDPTIPANAGALRPLTVTAPRGTIVAAGPPAAVGAGNVEVSQRVADVCLGALSLARPGTLGAASQGTMNNLIVGGDGWVYYETLAGGQGARPGRDGMSGVHTGMTNTRNTPIEALEQAFPMRVRRCRLRRESGGEGAARGGDGIERDLEVLEDATVSLITERRASRPWGAEGGGDGAAGENWLLPAGDETRATRLPDKCTVRVQAGDVIRVLTPGGGGWGSGGDRLGLRPGEVDVTADGTALRVEAVTETSLEKRGEWLIIPGGGEVVTVEQVQDLRDADQR